MPENLLAPGQMLLETSLNPGITTKPGGSIGERISKSYHLPHFRVVPEEKKYFEGKLSSKKISSPHFTFISKTVRG